MLQEIGLQAGCSEPDTSLFASAVVRALKSKGDDGKDNRQAKTRLTGPKSLPAATAVKILALLFHRPHPSLSFFPPFAIIRNPLIFFPSCNIHPPPRPHLRSGLIGRKAPNLESGNQVQRQGRHQDHGWLADRPRRATLGRSHGGSSTLERRGPQPMQSRPPGLLPAHQSLRHPWSSFSPPRPRSPRSPLQGLRPSEKS